MDKNRTRKNRISLRLDDAEMLQLQQNMKTANKTNREAYLRKMALDGSITTIDTKPTADLVRLVANISSNVKMSFSKTIQCTACPVNTDSHKMP
jgi:hypothetical protein